MTAHSRHSAPARPSLVPWSDDLGRIVFDDLDLHDIAEGAVVRGAAMSSMSLWADWRSMRGARLVDVVAISSRQPGAQPFAVFALSNTGQAGVAHAALLTRNVPDWRGDIGRLAVALRATMPGFCAEHGIHRVEARSWTEHPSGGQLLSACGLPHECRMRGFGADGTHTFDQHAWTNAGESKCA